MPGVAQRRTKLGGIWYDRGSEIPDELVNSRTVALGLVSPSSSGDDRAEVARLRNELAAAHARLEEAGITIDGTDDAQPFDPSEHTVGEVIGHVDAHPGDLDRVLDAELGGKARKTLLDELDRRQGEATANAGSGTGPIDAETGGDADASKPEGE